MPNLVKTSMIKIKEIQDLKYIVKKSIRNLAFKFHNLNRHLKSKQNSPVKEKKKKVRNLSLQIKQKKQFRKAIFKMLSFKKMNPLKSARKTTL